MITQKILIFSLSFSLHCIAMSSANDQEFTRLIKNSYEFLSKNRVGSFEQKPLVEEGQTRILNTCKRYLCNIMGCSKTFGSWQSYNFHRHMKHEGYPILRCNQKECRKYFYDPIYFKHHADTHKKEKKAPALRFLLPAT